MEGSFEVCISGKDALILVDAANRSGLTVAEFVMKASLEKASEITFARSHPAGIKDILTADEIQMIASLY
ncbi:hypothetical protein ACI2KR_08940 [Pseudomonas luteola]